MSFRNTAEHLEFLRSGYLEMRIPELTKAFNLHFDLKKTNGQIKSTLKNHKITCGRKGGHLKGVCLIFTQEQAEFIKAKYRDMPLSDLTNIFNERFDTEKTFSQLRSFTRNHKVKSGRTGRFEKGNKPHNTGTKGLMPGSSTSFKKGNIPKNLKPLGSERVCSKDGYILIKVAEKNPYNGQPTRYRAKHIVVYEKEHGPVPDGYMVRFADGDKLNCSPDNLELVSKRENLYLNNNGYSDLPEELKPTMKALAKVEIKVSSLLKEAAA